MSVLADTHALLPWIQSSGLLSREAKRALDRADVVLVSPLTFWEVAELAARQRVELHQTTHDWVDDVLAQERVALAPLSAQAAVDAALLRAGSFGGDPADAMLYATAREAGVPFVTRDERIHEHARTAKDVRVIW